MCAASPARNRLAVAHRFAHVAAQRCQRLLDRRAGHDPGCLIRGDAGEQLTPEPVIGPVVDGVGQRRLHVVAAQHRRTHRAEGEPTLMAGVHQDRQRRGLGQDAQPAEGVVLLELRDVRLRDRRPAHAVEPVATGDEVAVDPFVDAIGAVGDVRDWRGDVVQLDVGGLEHDVGAGCIGGCVEVGLDLGLAVRHHPLADPLHRVDRQDDAVMGEVDRLVDVALARPCASPSPTSRSVSTVPHSSTPARIRSRTYSRVRSSRTTLSTPARRSMWDSSAPAGPAPMMTTPVLIRRDCTQHCGQSCTAALVL